MKANELLRREVNKNGLFLWEVAYQLGVSESYFCRILRHELPENQRETCMRAIEAIVEGRRRAYSEGSDIARSRAYQEKLKSTQG